MRLVSPQAATSRISHCPPGPPGRRGEDLAVALSAPGCLPGGRCDADGSVLEVHEAGDLALGIRCPLFVLELSIDVDAAGGARFRVGDRDVVEAEADVLGLAPGQLLAVLGLALVVAGEGVADVAAA